HILHIPVCIPAPVVSLSAFYSSPSYLSLFLFTATATTEIYTLSLHDALPIYTRLAKRVRKGFALRQEPMAGVHGLRAGLAPRLRSEEHTSELQSLRHLVCRLLLEKKKKKKIKKHNKQIKKQDVKILIQMS